MLGDAALVDDRSLLELYARTRDAQAFRELAKRYAGLVYGTCLRVTQNPDDAEDVSQECFLELARRAGSINSSVAGWLHKVAKTRSINAIKRAGALRNREQQAFFDDTDDAGSAWADIAPYVDEAVERLPDNLRVPTILHYFHGLEQTQIAGQLQVSQPTVSRHLDKAVALLREDLRRAGIVAPVALLTVALAAKASTAAPAALTAELGKMAVSGIGGTAAAPNAFGTTVHAQTAARHFLGTTMGKVAAGVTVVGVVISAAYMSNTRVTASPSVPPRPPQARPAVRVTPAPPVARKAAVAASPMEAPRSDPFAPAGVPAVPVVEVSAATPPVADLPMPRIAQGVPAVTNRAPAPEPVQPVRRMAGLVQNNGLCAVIETNGKSEIVQPGDTLSDGLAVVQKIEPDKVVLRTVGDSPRELTIGISPAPVASRPPSLDQPSQPSPGIGMPIAGRPGVAVGGVPGTRRAMAVAVRRR